MKQATVPYAPAARSLTNSRKSSQKPTIKQHHWCEASDGAVRSCCTLPHKQQAVIRKTYHQTAPLMWSKQQCRTLLLHAPSQTAGSHHKNSPSNSTTDVKQATVPYAPAARSLTNSRKSSQKPTVKQHHWCEVGGGAVRSCCTLPHKQQAVIAPDGEGGERSQGQVHEHEEKGAQAVLQTYY